MKVVETRLLIVFLTLLSEHEKRFFFKQFFTFCFNKINILIDKRGVDITPAKLMAADAQTHIGLISSRPDEPHCSQLNLSFFLRCFSVWAVGEEVPYSLWSDLHT